MQGLFGIRQSVGAATYHNKRHKVNVFIHTIGLSNMNSRTGAHAPSHDPLYCIMQLAAFSGKLILQNTPANMSAD
jgi:hypothetical protein